MAKIHGIYPDDTVTEPKYVVVGGSEGEMRRIGERVTRPRDSFIAGPRHFLDMSDPTKPQFTEVDDTWSFHGPADKELVREIAKHVELDYDDRRLIDWMKA